MNRRLCQNIVNDGKFNKIKLLWVYLSSINFSSVNNPSAACKVVELFIYSVNLPWLTLPPVFIHRQDRIAKKKVCLAKHFTRINRILHRHACGACDKFYIWFDVVRKVSDGGRKESDHAGKVSDGAMKGVRWCQKDVR